MEYKVDRKAEATALQLIQDSPGLDYLTKYLSLLKNSVHTSKRPQTPGWALSRAWDDGFIDAVSKVEKWINDKLSYQPKG